MTRNFPGEHLLIAFDSETGNYYYEAEFDYHDEDIALQVAHKYFGTLLRKDDTFTVTYSVGNRRVADGA